MKIHRLLVGSALAAFALPASAAQLIVNGGFEAPLAPPPCCTTTPPTPIPGWTVTTGDVNVVTGTFASTNGNLAYEANQYLDLVGQSGSGSMFQTFNTIAGKTYTLSFAYSHNVFSVGAASAGFSVDGLMGTVSHNTGNSNGLDWQVYTNTFVASGNSATLTFTNTAGNQVGGVFLDAVSVTGAIPEPATWAMLILGFGLVGGAMRRRTRIAFAGTRALTAFSA